MDTQTENEEFEARRTQHSDGQSEQYGDTQGRRDGDSENPYQPTRRPRINTNGDMERPRRPRMYSSEPVDRYNRRDDYNSGRYNRDNGGYNRDGGSRYNNNDGYRQNRDNGNYNSYNRYNRDDNVYNSGGYNRCDNSEDVDRFNSYEGYGGYRNNRRNYDDNGNNGDTPQRAFRPRYRDNGGEQNNRYGNYNRDNSDNQPQRAFRPRYNRDNSDNQPQRAFRPRYNNNEGDGSYNSYNARPRYDNYERQTEEGPRRPMQRNPQGDGRYGNNRPYRQQGGAPRRPMNGGQRPQPKKKQPKKPNPMLKRDKSVINNDLFENEELLNTMAEGAVQTANYEVENAPKTQGEKPIPHSLETLRLNRFIAMSGVCSRREADDLIRQGLVTVNGQVITEMGVQVKKSDHVEYNGKSLTAERKVYVLLNKPKDCVTTTDDPEERRTVMDLVADACEERIYPVGRLDRNTTGVLLLTNDGELTEHLIHPRYGVRKIYHVFLDRNVSEEDIQRIMKGVKLEDGFIRVDDAQYVDGGDRKQVGVQLHSGKNRIVRRIFEHLGYEVEKLDRVYFAGLTKLKLPRGRWRFLTEVELNKLRAGFLK